MWKPIAAGAAALLIAGSSVVYAQYRPDRPGRAEAFPIADEPESGHEPDSGSAHLALTRFALELLHGAVDIHIHHGPDLYPRIQDPIELARDAQVAGIRAVCLKTHNFPTVQLALLTRKIVPGTVLVLTVLCFMGIGILWAGISQGGRIIIQFLGLAVLSRLLPASDFGVVALASIVTNFALLLRERCQRPIVARKRFGGPPVGSSPQCHTERDPAEHANSHWSAAGNRKP